MNMKTVEIAIGILTGRLNAKGLVPQNMTTENTTIKETPKKLRKIKKMEHAFFLLDKAMRRINEPTDTSKITTEWYLSMAAQILLMEGVLDFCEYQEISKLCTEETT